MLVALMSDTHDNEASTRAALGVLALRKPDLYLHAGDLVSAEMLELFRGLPLHFVFGNNEWDLAGLRSGALAAGVKCHEYLAEVDCGGKKVALLHGHRADVEALARSGKYDYVVHGHSHVRRDERVVSCRVINPGALHRAKVRTVALLDVGSDGLEFLEVRA